MILAIQSIIAILNGLILTMVLFGSADELIFKASWTVLTFLSFLVIRVVSKDRDND